MFISVEGTEGAGKSTLLRGLADELSQQHPLIVTREPGGTPLAERIRELVLVQGAEPLHPTTELLLMFAARTQHVEEVIRPALERGDWVLCDRFVDSTYAYQHAGRGHERALIDGLTHQFVPVQPDLTFWLDIPTEDGMARVRQRGQLDRFEQERLEFFERVRAGYVDQAQRSPERIVRLDASRPADELVQSALAHIQTRVG